MQGDLARNGDASGIGAQVIGAARETEGLGERREALAAGEVEEAFLRGVVGAGFASASAWRASNCEKARGKPRAREVRLWVPAAA